jgi:hypothetical protein
MSIEDCFKSIYQRKIPYLRYRGVIQSFLQFSRGFRTKTQDEESVESDCESCFFDTKVTSNLLSIAKEQNVTFNDLCVAVLTKIFGELTHEQRKNLKPKLLKPKRNRIIIGVMSNIRNQSQQSLTQVFGLFLSFFYLSLKSPENYSLQALTQSVHVKTSKMKQQHSAIKQYLLFKIQNKIWDRRTNKRSQYRLFNKNTPLTLGISNMNLNGCAEPLLQQAQQYIRFSPTAMVCPIVFNLTTFNGYLSIGINYRKACYTAEEVNHIKNQFILALGGLQ